VSATPTVTERSITLEPTTRDDVADAPVVVTVAAGRRRADRFVPQPEPTR
jgi:hypothetical protein